MVHIKIINDKYSNPHFALLQIVVFAGSIFESSHEKGITHFIEHLIFKGSKYTEAIKVLTDRLNSNGMSINAYTTNYNTVYKPAPLSVCSGSRRRSLISRRAFAHIGRTASPVQDRLVGESPAGSAAW